MQELSPEKKAQAEKERATLLLMECGRETAAELLHSALDTDNPTHRNNQIFVCEHAAVHILATIAFNDMKQNGKKMVSLFAEFCSKIKSEIEMLQEDDTKGELDLVKFNNQSEAPSGNQTPNR